MWKQHFIALIMYRYSNQIDLNLIYCSLSKIARKVSRIVMKESKNMVPISVIVPLFNREAFLPQLLNTLLSQTFQDFEVILVDDGSTDGSKKWIDVHFANSNLNYQYIFQENGGPYKARNNGLKHSSGIYIALFDSDDEWPAYHLSEFYNAMEQNPDIDWLFASIKRIEHESGLVLEETNFFENGKLHPVLGLKTVERVFENDGISVINDDRLPETMIEHTLPGSMQCSLIKREVFDFHIFDEDFRTTYDRFYCMRSAIAGFKFAFIKKTHLIYHVHSDNISTVGEPEPDKLLRSGKTLLRGYSIISSYSQNRRQKQAAIKCMSNVYAWIIGTAYQKKEQHVHAMKSYAKSFKLNPFNPLILKSFIVSIIKFIFKPFRLLFIRGK